MELLRPINPRKLEEKCGGATRAEATNAEAEAEEAQATKEDQCKNIHTATKEGKAECLQMLINAKADVNKKDYRGWTPANWTAYKGQAECLQILIDTKAESRCEQSE